MIYKCVSVKVMERDLVSTNTNTIISINAIINKGKVDSAAVVIRSRS